MRFASLEIHKEEFSFSAGHFTIFSETERESLHGHNYYVSTIFHFNVSRNGLSFDYRYYKKKILSLCEYLDRSFLLPEQSPYLKLSYENNYVIADFNQQKIPFLKEDVVILPITNTTIEELAHWFLDQLVKEMDLKTHHIEGIEVKVFNGPGQSSTAYYGVSKKSTMLR